MRKDTQAPLFQKFLLLVKDLGYVPEVIII
jgi:hypothetical protein